MEYKIDTIVDLHKIWRSYYDENDQRGESCVNFVLGDQWDLGVVKDRDLRGEESLVFNVASKHLLRVKGEAAKLDLSLVIKGENIPPDILKEGRQVLKRLVLSNHHLQAFQKVLHQVYDYGYGALLVDTKRVSPKDPMEEPSLNVIQDLKSCFWDIEAPDDCKTEGRYCGIKYQVQRKHLLGSDKRLGNTKSKNFSSNREDSCDVIDFWYREPFEETWYFTQDGKWRKDWEGSYLVKRKVQNVQVKFMRIVDKVVTIGPIDYYTDTKLPLVYWKGLEGIHKSGTNCQIKTLPYIYNIVDAQHFVNFAGSALVSRLKKLGGSKVIVTDSMIENKENYWYDFNRNSGVFQVNETDEGGMPQPMILPAEGIDASLLNTLQSSLQIMDQLAGITQAQQGAQEGVATNAGLHRQIMQGNILQNVILSNHLNAINEVGFVLKEMLPKVIIEERFLGEGLYINKPTSEHTPSAPKVRNDIRQLFETIDYNIEYGASSDAEKAANLIAIKEIISTNPSIAPYFADEFAANLNTANSDELRRRMEALMPPDIEKVGKGLMSIEEYQQKQQEKQQQQAQQPSLPERQLELQKQKILGEQQLKQADLQLKAAKMQQQGVKDAQNLKIKEAGVLSKFQSPQKGPQNMR